MKRQPTLSQMKRTFLEARQAYYEDPDGNTLMSDAEFDALEKTIARLDPDWHVLRTTGHTKKTDVELPNYMPSLGKIYSWTGRQSATGYVWTPKLDGTSLQLVYQNGKPVALYTRGNGITGGDVSFLLAFLDIPTNIPYKGELYLRCEGVLTREKFNRKWRRGADEKDARKFVSARAAVNGQFNRTVDQCIPELLADIDLVVVGVYNRRCGDMLKFAKSQGFKTAPELKFTDHVDHEALEAMLKWAKKAIPCDIDGLVGCVRTAVFQYPDNEFPAWSHAFKINEDGIEAVVKAVHWQISRYGRWTPVIELEPVDFDGITVTRATAHSAQWMYDRGLGVGAVIKIIRAGEVIPYIDSVVKRAKKFPYPPGKYKWDGAHLKSDGPNETSAHVNVLRMTNFLRGLGVEDIAAKSVQALVNQGYVSVPHIMADVMAAPAKKVFPQRILNALGNANGHKFAKSLWRICSKGLPLWKVIVFSGAMDAGLGKTNVQKIAKAIPLGMMVDTPTSLLYAKIKAIHGLGDAAATLATEGQPALRKILGLIQKAGVKVVIPTKTMAAPAVKRGPFNGMVGSWTGYRSKEEEALFISRGGVVEKLGAKTTHLFYNPDGKFMDKVEKFKAKGGKAVVWRNWWTGTV